jgi:hypothetical protein
MVEDKIKQVKHIGSRVGYFEINKIDKDGKDKKYRLIKTFSPELNQTELSEFYEKSKQNGNPLPINSLELGELYCDVMNSKNDNLKNYFFEALESSGVGTLTRIVYSLKDLEHWNGSSIEKCLSDDHEIYTFFERAFDNRGKDEIIHNYGTSDSFSYFADVLGNCKKTVDIDPDLLKKVIGISKPQKLNGYLSWFDGFNKIPQKHSFSFDYGSECPEFKYSAWVGMNSSRIELTKRPSYDKKSFLLERLT